MDQRSSHRRACSSKLASFEHPYCVIFGHRTGWFFRKMLFDTLQCTAKDSVQDLENSRCTRQQSDGFHVAL
jgi:hypothetical protein